MAAARAADARSCLQPSRLRLCSSDHHLHLPPDTRHPDITWDPRSLGRLLHPSASPPTVPATHSRVRTKRPRSPQPPPSPAPTAQVSPSAIGQHPSATKRARTDMSDE